MMSPLGQRNIGDWIEGLLVLAVIVFSVIGSLVKGIVEKARKKQLEKQAEREARDGGRKVVTVERRTITQRPVARPFPTGQAPTEVQTREVPPGKSIPEVMAELFPEFVHPPRKPKQAMPVERPTPSPAPPPPIARPQRPQPRPKAQPRPARAPAPVRPAAPVDAHRDKHGTLKSSFDRPETEPATPPRRRRQPVEKNQPSYDLSGDTAYAILDEVQSLFAQPTVSVLRKAIVLSEILAPPRALRPMEERWS